MVETPTTGESEISEIKYLPLALLVQAALTNDGTMQDPRFVGLPADVRIDRALATWYGIEAESSDPLAQVSVAEDDPELLLSLARLADANTAILDIRMRQEIETARYLGHAIAHGV